MIKTSCIEGKLVVSDKPKSYAHCGVEWLERFAFTTNTYITEDRRIKHMSELKKDFEAVAITPDTIKITPEMTLEINGQIVKGKDIFDLVESVNSSLRPCPEITACSKGFTCPVMRSPFDDILSRINLADLKILDIVKGSTLAKDQPL